MVPRLIPLRGKEKPSTEELAKNSQVLGLDGEQAAVPKQNTVFKIQGLSNQEEYSIFFKF